MEVCGDTVWDGGLEAVIGAQLGLPPSFHPILSSPLSLSLPLFSRALSPRESSRSSFRSFSVSCLLVTSSANLLSVIVGVILLLVVVFWSQHPRGFDTRRLASKYLLFSLFPFEETDRDRPIRKPKVAPAERGAKTGSISCRVSLVPSRVPVSPQRKSRPPFLHISSHSIIRSLHSILATDCAALKQCSSSEFTGCRSTKTQHLLTGHSVFSLSGTSRPGPFVSCRSAACRSFFLGADIVIAKIVPGAHTHPSRFIRVYQPRTIIMR